MPKSTPKKKIPVARREFSRQLRLLRVAKGYKTAREFAGVLEVKEDRYTRWERAETEPNISNILRISQALGTDPNDLFLPLISGRNNN